VSPAGTVTLYGTKAGKPLVHRLTTTPPAVAGALSDTDPATKFPATTLPGTVTETSAGAGFTAIVVVFVVSLKNAVIVLWVAVDVELVVIGNVALVAPSGTVTFAGTKAGEPLVQRATVRPPAGAAAFSVTVPVAGLPAFTGFGAADTELIVTVGVTVIVVDRVTPL